MNSHNALIVIEKRRNKIFNFIKNFLKNSRNVSIVLFSICPIFSYIMVELIQGSGILLDLELVILNLLFLYSIQLIIYAITSSYKKSILISNIILYIVSIINYVVTDFRGSPIVPWDILCIKVALNVSSSFNSITITPGLIIGTSLFIIITILTLKLKYESSKTRKKFLFKLCSSLIITAFIICFYTTNLIDYFNTHEDLWEPIKEYHDNGFVASIFKSSKKLFISAPSGYSVDKVLDIFNEITLKISNTEPLATTSNEKPNIVVIIDESFADLSVLGNLELSEDYLPFIHSLQADENVISGNLHSSVYGGQTPNTEWEFLTGNTMAFMPTRTVPFQQYIHSETQSLVSTLEEQGYTSSAFHSYYKNGYRRTYVYSFLGFDTFLDIDTLNNLNYLREYPDDRSTFQNIINLFENKSDDEKIFNYTLTMQNHSSYDFTDYEATITQSNPEYFRTDQYLSVANESDTAFKELLEYFEDYDEPTIVLFFGDHQPRVDDELVEELLNSHDNPDSKEVQEKKYITPFIIWANYDLNIEDESLKNIDDISLNYLSGVLLRIANLETTPYMDYLEDLRQSIPVITGNGYMTNDGAYHDISDNTTYKDLLDDYSYLQYNNVFENSDKLNELFEIKNK